MTLTRCDICCDILDGIDNGTIYDCSSTVYNKLSIEHICEDCLASSDNLVLTNPSKYAYVVEFKVENHE